MTESEMQQLSREVAEKVVIEPIIFEFIPMTHVFGMNSNHTEGYEQHVWLHEDNARCFELMVKYKIDVTPCSRIVFADMDSCNQSENYSDHNNDAELATRIAILKAVKEVA